MQKLKFTETEVTEQKGTKIKRYPNLNTVLMVEDFLKKHRDMPIKISELKRKLPKKVMHQTLKVILQYLFENGKIIIDTKGVQWIYSESEHIKKMLDNSIPNTGDSVPEVREIKKEISKGRFDVEEINNL